MLSILNFKTLHKKNFLLFNRIQATHQKTSSLDNNQEHRHSEMYRFAGTLVPLGSSSCGGAGQTGGTKLQGEVPGTLFSAVVGPDEEGPRGSWRKVCTKNLECDG